MSGWRRACAIRGARAFVAGAKIAISTRHDAASPSAFASQSPTGLINAAIRASVPAGPVGYTRMVAGCSWACARLCAEVQLVLRLLANDAIRAAPQCSETPALENSIFAQSRAFEKLRARPPPVGPCCAGLLCPLWEVLDMGAPRRIVCNAATQLLLASRGCVMHKSPTTAALKLQRAIRATWAATTAMKFYYFKLVTAQTTADGTTFSMRSWIAWTTARGAARASAKCVSQHQTKAW